MTDKLTPTPLLPCPFCGNAERPRIIDDFQLYGDDGARDGYFAVCCSESGAPGCGSTSGWYSTKAQVIAAWNRRAPVEPPRALSSMGGGE